MAGESETLINPDTVCSLRQEKDSEGIIYTDINLNKDGVCVGLDMETVRKRLEKTTT